MGQPNRPRQPEDRLIRPHGPTTGVALWFAHKPILALCAFAFAGLLAAFGAADLRVTSNLATLRAQSAGLEAPESQVLVVLGGSESQQVVGELAEQLRTIDGVSHVVAPLHTDDSRVDGLIRAAWGSDQQSSLLVVDVAPGTDSGKLTHSLRQATDHYAAPVTLVGTPILDVAHARAGIAEQRQRIPAVFIVFAVLLAALTRRVAGVVLPLVSVAASGLLLAGFMGWAGYSLAGPSLLLLPLVFIMGLADSVHLLRRYALERESLAPQPALEAALHAVAPACLLTSVTTAISFLCLGFSGAPLLREFGGLAALGMALAWICGLGLPAAVLALLPSVSPCAPPSQWLQPRLRAFAVRLRERPMLGRAPLAAGLLVCLVALPSLSLDLNYMDAMPQSDPAVLDHRRVDRELGGLFPLHIIYRSEISLRHPEPMEGLVELRRVLRRNAAVGSAFSFADVLQTVGQQAGSDANRIVGHRGGMRGMRVNRYRRVMKEVVPRAQEVVPVPLVSDNGDLHVWVRLHATGAKSWAKLLGQLEQFDERVLQRATLTYEGFGAVTVAAWKQLREDLWSVFGFSFAAMTLGLFVQARSVGRVAWALLPLSLTLGTVLTAMVFAGIPLSYTNLFVTSAALGLGVDALIHLQRNDDLPKALSTTGISILWSAMLLVAGLAVLIPSDLPAVHQIGFTLLVGMAANPVWTFLAVTTDPFAPASDAGSSH